MKLMFNDIFKIRRIQQVPEARSFPIHVISPDSYDEKTLMRNEAVNIDLRGHGFTDVNFVRGAYLPREPVRGCSLSHAIAVQQAMRGTTPFILLENDAIFETPALPLEVPDDADAVYLGISSGGLAMNVPKPPTHHWKGNFYSWCRASNLVRIYNMLSTHAVLICSDRYAHHWQLCAVESALRGEPIDVVLARSHRYFNVYAQKKPWWYQADRLGGQEKYSRVEFHGTQINSLRELPQQLPSFTMPCLSADLAAMK